MPRKCITCLVDKISERCAPEPGEVCVTCQKPLEGAIVSCDTSVFVDPLRHFLLKSCDSEARSGVKKVVPRFPLSAFLPVFGDEGLCAGKTKHSQGTQLKRILTTYDQVARLCDFGSVPYNTGSAIQNVILTKRGDISLIAPPVQLSHSVNKYGHHTLTIKYNIIGVSNSGRIRYATDFPTSHVEWGKPPADKCAPGQQNTDLRIRGGALAKVCEVSAQLGVTEGVQEALKAENVKVVQQRWDDWKASRERTDAFLAKYHADKEAKAAEAKRKLAAQKQHKKEYAKKRSEYPYILKN
jgi:hypothetical protein